MPEISRVSVEFWDGNHLLTGRLCRAGFHPQRAVAAQQPHAPTAGDTVPAQQRCPAWGCARRREPAQPGQNPALLGSAGTPYTTPRVLLDITSVQLGYETLKEPQRLQAPSITRFDISSPRLSQSPHRTHAGCRETSAHPACQAPPALGCH